MTPARQRARIVELLGETLLASPWLARLGRISFLGTLDQHPRSRRASNRLEHSLGVAGLAADAAADLELPRERAQLFVAACLLHDIGHYPLSHAAEPAFAKLLGAGHHEVGRWIVLGTGPIPRLRSLAPSLEQLGLDPALVWALVDRSPTLAPELAPLAALLEAPINLDTLEGIHRVARDFRLRSRKLPGRIFTWIQTEAGVELGIAREAVPAIDRFWLLKDQVYDRVINLPSNILAEARLCELVASKLDPELIDALDVFDDKALRRKLGAEALARALLDDSDDRDYELWASEGYGEMVRTGTAAVERRPLLVRTRKRYYVDPAVEPGREGLLLSQWSRRYRHERTRGWLVSRRQDQLDLPLPGLVGRAEDDLSSEAPEI
ncbi:MAG: HD domain-containing protein [Enhygromyxa sp.]